MLRKTWRVADRSAPEINSLFDLHTFDPALLTLCCAGIGLRWVEIQIEIDNTIRDLAC